MIPDATAEMVCDAPALRALCAELHQQPWIAVDTEFLREDTYRARLALIQVGTPTRIACVDPLALDDLQPFFEVLANPEVVKVFHSASQDLEIFHQIAGRIPAPIFDTQIAAPLLGHGDQIGFARLVEEVVGVELDKSQSRTNWLERPLPQAAIEYAGNDVRYLVPLYLHMHGELERRGRLDWLAPEMEALTRPERYERAAEDAWRRLRGIDRLPAIGRAIARDVAAWREQTARERDIPRGRVLRDEIIIDVAKTRPANQRQLERIRGLKGPALERHGRRLLELVASARAEDAPALDNGNREAPLDAAGEALVDALSALVRLRCASEDLNPQTVAGRKDLTRIVAGRPVEEVLGGWRAALLGEDINDLLTGRRVLAVGDRGLELRAE